ncbi:hypothetical protein BG015_001807 [Linnemannia schmuckeri]|uniref:Transmembrane protein n=1 Tax=Linnemannia schmuckeri TaxID=64567 RepID=A0A9P5RPT5_9FUNG|nr:hypothetical protein BG015_001807 [Linnemannia schmuckeri]
MKFNTISHLSWPVFIMVLLASVGITSAIPISTTLDQPRILEKVNGPVVSIRVPKRDLPSPAAAAPEEESEDEVSLSKRRMMVYGQIRYVNPAHYRKRENPSTSESEEEIDPKRQIATENPFDSIIRAVTRNPPVTVSPEGERFEPEAEEGDVELSKRQERFHPIYKKPKEKMKFNNIPLLPLSILALLFISASTIFTSTVPIGQASATPVLTHALHKRKDRNHGLDNIDRGVNERDLTTTTTPEAAEPESGGHTVELTKRWRRVQVPFYKMMVDYLKRDVLPTMPDELEKESEVEGKQEEEEEEPEEVELSEGEDEEDDEYKYE